MPNHYWNFSYSLKDVYIINIYNILYYIFNIYNKNYIFVRLFKIIYYIMYYIFYQFGPITRITTRT